MTWKNGRRLATFTKGDVSASFDYDADGLRTTKTVGTSRVDYYRVGGLLLGEVHTDGSESYTINYMYDESGRMLGFRLDGAEYYYVRDYAGDVTGLINARGELIGSYLYDPWGVLLETYLNTFEEETAEWTDADRVEYMRVLNLNPIRYKSYYYDTETGFYYLQSRYYDPITTRFINADGLVSTGTGVLGYNMFAYCDNNPISYYDNSGLIRVGALERTRKYGLSSDIRQAGFDESLVLEPNVTFSSLPKTGEPNSIRILPNPDGTPKQKRWYGPDGNAEHDRDYNHPGNMPFPHDHDWENGKRGEDHLPPDPSYEMNWEPVIGVGLVVICTVGIVAFAVDDVTGVGVADDFLFGPLGVGVGEGLTMIFDY